MSHLSVAAGKARCPSHSHRGRHLFPGLSAQLHLQFWERQLPMEALFALECFCCLQLKDSLQQKPIYRWLMGRRGTRSKVCVFRFPWKTLEFLLQSSGHEQVLESLSQGRVSRYYLGPRESRSIGGKALFGKWGWRRTCPAWVPICSQAESPSLGCSLGSVLGKPAWGK